MIYLLSLALVVWLLGFADKRTTLKQNNYKYYTIIAGTLVALVMGLRTQYTGSTDTRMYMMFFEQMAEHNSFLDYYDRNLAETEFIFSETGFYLFMWLLSRITQEGQILVLVTSGFITFCVCRFIYKNTQDPPTGLLVYVCLGLFTFNMSGMRQALAMSICMLGYELVKKRKLFWFLAVVFVAMQFHKTAFCFGIVYIFPLLKEGKLNIFWYLVGMVVFLLSVNVLVNTFNAFTGEDYDVTAQADGGGVTVIFIYTACILLGLIMYDSLKKRELRTAYLSVVAGFACYIARFFSTEIMERLSYYFFYFTLLLIPELINELEEQERKVVKLLFGLFALLLLWYRVRNGAFANFKFFFYYT